MDRLLIPFSKLLVGVSQASKAENTTNNGDAIFSASATKAVKAFQVHNKISQPKSTPPDRVRQGVYECNWVKTNIDGPTAFEETADKPVTLPNLCYVTNAASFYKPVYFARLPNRGSGFTSTFTVLEEKGSAGKWSVRVSVTLIQAPMSNSFEPIRMSYTIVRQSKGPFDSEYSDGINPKCPDALANAVADFIAEVKALS